MTMIPPIEIAQGSEWDGVERRSPTGRSGIPFDPVGYGQLVERVGHLGGSVNQIGQDVKDLSKAMQELVAAIQNTKSQIQGGWKVVVFTGSAIVVVAGFIAWVVEQIVHVMEHVK